MPDTMSFEDFAKQGGVPLESIDTTSGAPANVRAAVGAAHLQRDKLATLRKFFPDAREWKGSGNFIYTDPRTGRATVYNETNPEFMGIPVPTLGDVVSAGPEITEGAGATAGGIIGSRAGPGTAMAGAGLGGMAGQAAYDAFANLGLGTVDTRNLPEHASDLALAGAANVAGEGISRGIGRGVQYLTGATPRAAETLAAAQRMGVDVTPGAVADNRLVQGAEAVMSQAPITSGPVSTAQQRMIEQTGQAAQRTAAEAAGRPVGLGEAEAGDMARRGAEAAGERFAAIRNRLDDRLVQAVGADTQVPIRNAADTWQQLTAQLQRSPDVLGRTVSDARGRLGEAMRDAGRNLGIDAERLAGDPNQWEPEVLADVMRRGTVPFDVLRQARTSLGKALERPDASGLLPEGAGAVRQAYDALRGDIQAAARNAGPGAERLLSQHDRYVTAYRGGADAIMDRLTGLTETKTGQEAFNKLWTLATRDADGFGRVVRRLRANERDQLASAIIGKLGEGMPGAQNAAGDVFSPATYLSNWNKLRPGTKRLLFGQGRNRELARAMDDLALLVEGQKKAGAFRNTSNTAAHLGMLGAAGGLGAAGVQALQGHATPLVATLGLMGGARGLSELWTSPRFVRWMGQTALGLNRSTDPAGFMKNALARLATIGKAEPELRELLEVYRGQLQGVGYAPAEQKEKGR